MSDLTKIYNQEILPILENKERFVEQDLYLLQSAIKKIETENIHFNLKQIYQFIIRPALQKINKAKSIMQVPRIEKIVLNMTAGNEVSNSKAIEEVKNELMLISGQKPLATKAKKSLASWKLREGMDIGGKVTLRNDKMWNFLQKLIDIALPRTRDFRGLSKNSFDSYGNYALGIKEHVVFPEINFDKVRKIKGLDVIIVTNTKNKNQASALLILLGMPFKRKNR